MKITRAMLNLDEKLGGKKWGLQVFSRCFDLGRNINQRLKQNSAKVNISLRLQVQYV